MIVESGIVATLLAPPVPSSWYGCRLSHPLRRVRWCDECCSRSTRGLAAVDPVAQRKRATSTSAFGVSRRENHDASGFYGRFPAPTLSGDDRVEPPGVVDQIYVGDARSMDRVRPSSVALVVTSPPYFAGKAYEAELGEGHIPATYVEYLTMLEDVFAECVEKLEAGRSHRGQRRQPRPQALPVAVGRRHRHPAGPARAPPARRGDLAQGPRRGSELRVGLVQEPGQPGAARPHRACGDRQQGPLRPSPQGARRG